MQFSNMLLSDAEVCNQDLQENTTGIQKTNLQQREMHRKAMLFSQNFTARPSPPSQQPRRMKHLQPAVADADLGGHMQHHDLRGRRAPQAQLPWPRGQREGATTQYLGPLGFSLPPFSRPRRRKVAPPARA